MDKRDRKFCRNKLKSIEDELFTLLKFLEMNNADVNKLVKCTFYAQRCVNDTGELIKRT